jgi:hypothetical protein
MKFENPEDVRSIWYLHGARTGMDRSDPMRSWL